MSSSPPLVVADRYRLVAPLGQGGMGRVWRATDVVLHRDVAIKELVPPPGLTAEERQEMRERSLREARAIARLNNVNVVRVFDVLRTDADPWIVMEYVESRSLQDTLASDGPFNAVRAAEIGLGVLGALRAAHRAGVVHRDVKPGNVLIGADGRVVLTDFGLATVPGDPNVTRTGLVLGSPAYIAPERARDGSAGPAADLWSLGATLYAAVEGASPFARPSAIATLAALATENPPPARNAGALKPVLNGLLRKDPSHRINADEAERLLLRAAGRRSKMSFPMSPTMRRPGIGRERPALPGGPGSLGPAAGAAPVVPGPRPPLAPAAGQAPVSPGRPTSGQDRPPVYVPGKAPVGRPAETPPRSDPPQAAATRLDATRVDAPAVKDDRTKLFGTRRGSSTAPGQSAAPPVVPAEAASSGGLTRTGRGEQGSFTAADVAAYGSTQAAPEQEKPTAAAQSTPVKPARSESAPTDAGPGQTAAVEIADADPVPTTAGPGQARDGSTGIATEGMPPSAEPSSPAPAVAAAGAPAVDEAATPEAAAASTEAATPSPAQEPEQETAQELTPGTAQKSAPETPPPTAEAVTVPPPSKSTGARPKPGKSAKKSRPSPTSATPVAAAGAAALIAPEARPADAATVPADAATAPAADTVNATTDAPATPGTADAEVAEKDELAAQAAQPPAGTAKTEVAEQPAAAAEAEVAQPAHGTANDLNHLALPLSRPKVGRQKTATSGPATSGPATSGPVAADEDNAPISPIGALGLPARPAWRPMDAAPSRPGVTIFGTRLTYRQAVVGAVILLLILILLITLVARAVGEDGSKSAATGPQATPTAVTQGPTPQNSVAATTPPASTPPSAAPSSPAASAPVVPGSIKLPAGWKWYREKASGKFPAYTVPVPNGVSVSRESDGETYLRWNNRVLLVGRTGSPKPDVKADWITQERERRGGYRNYRLVKPIDYVSYPGFKRAADWEFLYTTDNGNDQHAVKRNISVSAKAAYSLSWYTTPGDWAAAQSELQLIYQGFQPK